MCRPKQLLLLSDELSQLQLQAFPKPLFQRSATVFKETIGVNFSRKGNNRVKCQVTLECYNKLTFLPTTFSNRGLTNDQAPWFLCSSWLHTKSKYRFLHRNKKGIIQLMVGWIFNYLIYAYRCIVKYECYFTDLWHFGIYLVPVWLTQLEMDKAPIFRNVNKFINFATRYMV